MHKTKLDIKRPCFDIHIRTPVKLYTEPAADDRVVCRALWGPVY